MTLPNAITLGLKLMPGVSIDWSYPSRPGDPPMGHKMLIRDTAHSAKGPQSTLAMMPICLLGPQQLGERCRPTMAKAEKLSSCSFIEHDHDADPALWLLSNDTENWTLGRSLGPGGERCQSARPTSGGIA